VAGFELATATEIVFGRGRLRELPARVSGLGQRALLVAGADPTRAAGLRALLADAKLEVTLLQVIGEPSVDLARAGVELVREAGCDWVLGFGGGSALDAAKAIAALAGNPGDPLDYLEVVGRGRKLVAPALPCVAIPTTAGTGSEVTKNAVLGVLEQRVKVSLRGLSLLPRLALVDSELTHSMPPALTAATGLDALTQVLEPYVSIAANPLVDVLALEGVRRAARSLRRAFVDGNDADAREDMAMTSLLGGLSLANAKLGAVHGFASPLGGRFSAPHGAICARLLPLVMSANLLALRARAPQSPALERYHELGKLLTGRGAARAEDGIEWLSELVADFSIPGLASYGLCAAEVSSVVAQARNASSMKGNPIELTPDELTEILERAL
jgi:alcohol dehydrogenase class IV